MPIAQTAAYLNSSSASLMGHFSLLIWDKTLSWIAFYLDTTGHLSLRLCVRRSHKGYLSILFYSVILKCGYQDGRDLSLNFFRMKQWIDLIFFFNAFKYIVECNNFYWIWVWFYRGGLVMGSSKILNFWHEIL